MPTTLQSVEYSPPLVAKSETSPVIFTVGMSSVLLTVLFFANRPDIFRMATCVCALAVGVALYLKHPISYIQYALCLWFVTPLLRRMIDLRFGFVDQNLVLLAPLLVTGISVLCLRDLPQAKINKLPFVLCMAAVFYGLIIGLLTAPSAETIYGFLNWIAPPLLGLLLYLHWRSYAEMKRGIQTVLLWGIVGMGAYGIYQYCLPPKWDVYWWQSLPYGLVAAFGRPFPYQVRVWSTLNAPAPFASVAGICLLLNLGSRSKLALPFSLIGFLAFALSLVRAEWLGFVIGILYVGFRSKPIYLVRGVAIMLILIAIAVPLLSIGGADQVVQERIDSFSHLSQDDSVQTRVAMYERLTGDLLQNPFGHGVSNAAVYQGYSLDSGFLTLLYNFGLLGTAFYAVGIAAALFLLVRRNSSGDIFQLACAGVLLSSLIKMVALSPFMNVSGVMVWLCIGMGLAAQRSHQASLEEKCI